MNRWDAFWHAQAPTLGLGLFRIAFACALWREVSTSAEKNTFSLQGGFHLPYIEGFGQFSQQLFDLLHVGQFPLIVLLALGVFPRIAAGILTVIHGMLFFSDALNFRNHPYFFLLLLAVFVLAPIGRSVSVHSLMQARQHQTGCPGFLGATEHPITWQRLMQVQVCWVYLIAGLHKLNVSYLAGDQLAYQMYRSRDRLKGQLHALFAPETAELWLIRLQSAEFMEVPSWISVALEIGLGFGLLFPRTRPVAFVVGIGFHLSIAILMHVYTFSAVMIASYLLFVSPTFWRRWTQGGP